ncbi:MAG: FHA domain-containing protein, partial [Planctomycetota bacterium]
AKVLKPGDLLKLGKLEFEVVIEHGLHAPKKPEVSDVGDAAQRVVKNAEDSRFEELDVNSWLDEADQIDRSRKLTDPETRQFRVDDVQTTSVSDSDSEELSVSDDSQDSDDSSRRLGKRPPKAKPGKIPDELKRKMQNENSRDAADDALKKFFTGR